MGGRGIDGAQGIYSQWETPPWASLTPEINDSSNRKPLRRGQNDPLESAFTLRDGRHWRQKLSVQHGVRSQPQTPKSQPSMALPGCLSSLGHTAGGDLQVQLLRSICLDKGQFYFLPQKGWLLFLPCPPRLLTKSRKEESSGPWIPGKASQVFLGTLGGAPHVLTDKAGRLSCDSCRFIPLLLVPGVG